MRITIHGCEWKNDTHKIAIIGDVEINLPVKNRLEWMQKVVGGLIEIYHHNGRDLVFNEEGLLHDLPLNPWAAKQGMHLVGTIIEVHGVLD